MSPLSKRQVWIHFTFTSFLNDLRIHTNLLIQKSTAVTLNLLQVNANTLFQKFSLFNCKIHSSTCVPDWGRVFKNSPSELLPWEGRRCKVGLVVAALADPGFPRGGHQPVRMTPTYCLTNFSQKLHENEDISAGSVLGTPPRNTNGWVWKFTQKKIGPLSGGGAYDHWPWIRCAAGRGILDYVTRRGLRAPRGTPAPSAAETTWSANDRCFSVK